MGQKLKTKENLLYVSERVPGTVPVVETHLPRSCHLHCIAKDTYLRGQNFRYGGVPQLGCFKKLSELTLSLMCLFL